MAVREPRTVQNLAIGVVLILAALLIVIVGRGEYANKFLKALGATQPGHEGLWGVIAVGITFSIAGIYASNRTPETATAPKTPLAIASARNAAKCPDSDCNGTETCSSCPQDCGACAQICPDGACNGTETCSACPQDCGTCAPTCPDGQCNGTETCTSCIQDCGACPCWSPKIDTDTDTTGIQNNGEIAIAVTVEVREAVTGLEARVCKLGDDVFSNDIAFSIYDGATYSDSGIAVAILPTQEQACSSWVQLKNSARYSKGQQFGGVWQVISPALSATDWGFPASACVVNGTPTGTCWNGVNITLTHTCK